MVWKSGLKNGIERQFIELCGKMIENGVEKWSKELCVQVV